MFPTKLIFAVCVVFALGTTGVPIDAEGQPQDKVPSKILEQKEATEIGDALLKGIILDSDDSGNVVKLRWNPAINTVPCIVMTDSDGNERSLQYNLDPHVVKKRQITDVKATFNNGALEGKVSGQWNDGKGKWSGNADLGGNLGGQIGSSFNNDRHNWNVGANTNFKSGQTSINGQIGGSFGKGQGNWHVGGSHTFGGGGSIQAGISWKFG